MPAQPTAPESTASAPARRGTAGRRLATAGVTGALLIGGLAYGAVPAGAATAGTDARAAATQRQQSAHAIPFTDAEVTRQDDGSFTVTWTSTAARHVTVYAGRDRDHVAHRHAVAHGSGTDSVTVRGLGPADRWWFELVPDRGESLTLADRSLHLASAPNFRDAGGYRTADGQWVRMGVIYRSGDLSRLTDADLATLRRLGIATDVDLRTEAERAASPDRLPEGTDHVVADVLAGSDVTSFPMTTEEEAAAAMAEGERTMVSGDSARAAYRTLLTTAADRRAAAVVYHCTAGKDRTGWASAAILTALGVPAETVMEDYLASNGYRAEENAAALAQVPEELRPAYRAVLDVRPEYLAAGFDEVEAAWGGFDGYLRDALGLSGRDLRDLRRALLVG
ncbi:tyrosine-protein phosphatase [Streptomyces sp. RFCAC02]|uniref:tyrosine-protein phosphatase n=1 Tax=Streptomyces sp. RFCAC02 TaxID=2499143 RepID=UPI00101E8E8A|nr:tyrosine-protein phosphatase [Streptomyces sp. RFCAC02]